MQDNTIFVPFILILLAALSAAGVGQTGWLKNGNGRFNMTIFSWLLAVAPLTAFIWLVQKVAPINSGETVTAVFQWLPSFSLNFSFYLDGLSLLFALLVTGIGTLIIIYSGYYFQKEPTAWRFLTYLLLFMASMLGLVLAGNTFVLFIFWEGTSITSFLLVAYKYNYPEARRGAFKAFFITGSGGIALLFGLLLVYGTTGESSLPAILSSGEILRDSALYPLMLGLLALAALTKSAPIPFPHLAAASDECPHPRQCLSAFSHNGESRHLPDGAAKSSFGTDGVVVLAPYHYWPYHYATGGIPRLKANRSQSIVGLFHHQPAWRDDDVDWSRYRHRF